MQGEYTVSRFQGSLRAGVAAFALSIGAVCATSPALAQGNITLPSVSLEDALNALSHQTGAQILVDQSLLKGKRAQAIKGVSSPEAALAQLLRGSGLTWQKRGDAFLIVRGSDAARPVSNAKPDARPSAQTIFVPNTNASDDGEVITVTGTRIIQNGYRSPTPVTVIGEQAIAAEAQPNIANFLERLPMVTGFNRPQQNHGSINSSLSGTNLMSLHGLGTTRTLVLLDGHRSPGSVPTGEVDINTIPQDLIKRIDIVTGGASMDYGSGAVGGVVNFILDKKYTGLKFSADYGETARSENPSVRLAATYGTDFAAGRGHFLLNGEFYNQAGMHDLDRAWNKRGYHIFYNPAYVPGNGQPELLVRSNVWPAQATPGGLVLSGPLEGTYFGTGGSINQLNYGIVGGNAMLGGDGQVTSQNYVAGADPAQHERRRSVFGRANYEVTPDINVFAEASYAKSKDSDNYLDGYPQIGGIPILQDNAFLPTSVRTQMQQHNLSSLLLGTVNTGLPPFGGRADRSVQRYLVGAEGIFSISGRNLHWDVFGLQGITNAYYATAGNWNLNRMALAQDAVFAPAGNSAGIVAGTIVCRSTLSDPNNGCKPLSRVGIDGGSQDPAAYQAGIDYVFGSEYPYHKARQNLTNMGFNISGSPIDGWAGPIQVAFGGEWRREAYSDYVPQQYISGWYAGNFVPLNGYYYVWEGYAETTVPLLRGMDFNGGVRYSHYSTSGGITTYKAGINYQLIEDIRLRFVYSRDMRAPTISDLFTTGYNYRAIVYTLNGRQYNSSDLTVGNRNLKPEKSDNISAGAILTPRFIPGLTAEINYYDIKLKDIIGSVSSQQAAEYCFLQHQQNFCQNIDYTGTFPDVTIAQVRVGGVNFQSRHIQGLDIGLTYQVPTTLLPLPGRLTLSTQATHYFKDITTTVVAPPVDAAGSPSAPGWLYYLTADYRVGNWTVDLTGRGVSSLAINNSYIVCSSNCPMSSTNNHTIDFNSVPGDFVVDLTLFYDLKLVGTTAKVFFNVKNLFDRDPPAFPTGPDSFNYFAEASTTNGLSELLGRSFRVGVKVSF